MSALKRLYPAEAAKLDGLLDVVREHMRRSGFQVTTGIEEFQPIPRHSDWHFGRDQQGPIVHAWVTWVSESISQASPHHRGSRELAAAELASLAAAACGRGVFKNHSSPGYSCIRGYSCNQATLVTGATLVTRQLLLPGQ